MINDMYFPRAYKLCSPTKGKGDILLLEQIPLVLALVSVSALGHTFLFAQYLMNYARFKPNLHGYNIGTVTLT